jgi:GNAT superfamily N-acetyltransferase
VSDADDIARLTGQLGYRVPTSAIAERLSRILARSDHQFLIAEWDGGTVGWLHAVVSELVEAEPFVWVYGLVVDANHRGKGIGRMLMQRCEDWRGSGNVPLSACGRARSEPPRMGSMSIWVTRISRRSTRSRNLSMTGAT